MKTQTHTRPDRALRPAAGVDRAAGRVPAQAAPVVVAVLAARGR